MFETLAWCCIGIIGGVASTKKVIHGILIGSSTSVAEYLDATTIVTRLSNEQESKTSHFKMRREMAANNMEKKAPLGVVLHEEHPSLKENGVEFPGEERFALAGLWVMSDCWIDWLNTKRRTTGGKIKVATQKTLLIKLEKLDHNNIWWTSDAPSTLPVTKNDNQQHEPALTKEVGSREIQNSLEPNTIYPSCQHVIIRRYTQRCVCGRPECPTSSSSDYFDHLGLTRTFREAYIQQRVPKHDTATFPFNYIPATMSTPSKEQFRA